MRAMYHIEEGKMEKKVYFKNIDFLRFMLAVMIVIIHIIHIAALPLLNTQAAFLYRDNTVTMARCVEFFFIISGFFLILTYKPALTVVDFIKGKAIRLLPVIVFTLIIFLIISLFGITKFWAMDNIFTLLFLSGMQVANHPSPYQGLGNIHSAWFVSVLFWISLLYFYLIKYFNKHTVNLFTVTTVLLSSYWLSYNVNLVIHTFVIRGLFGIGLGCILGFLYKEYAYKLETLNFNFIAKIFFTLLEMGTLGYLIFGLCLSKKDRLVIADLIFLFVVTFILFILKQGYFSKLLENNISVFLGHISYSIFITHNLWLDIFQKYYFIPNGMGANIFTSARNFFSVITLPLLVCILFGALTYFLVEKPMTKYLNKKFIAKKRRKND